MGAQISSSQQVYQTKRFATAIDANAGTQCLHLQSVSDRLPALSRQTRSPAIASINTHSLPSRFSGRSPRPCVDPLLLPIQCLKPRTQVDPTCKQTSCFWHTTYPIPPLIKFPVLDEIVRSRLIICCRQCMVASYEGTRRLDCMRRTIPLTMLPHSSHAPLTQQVCNMAAARQRRCYTNKIWLHGCQKGRVQHLLPLQ